MQISVVIPVLNEADRIADTIEKTRQSGPCEIVVVDGGSTDGTLEAATGADLCLVAPRGRASQQNLGAQASRGEALLFLHADCWPEPGCIHAIRQTLTDDRCIGGCFRQRIDAQGSGYRLLEAGNTARVRLLRWAYGDQGIFVRRQVFERLGGFPSIDLMEDLYFMKRLKREGTFRVLDHRLHVSPRRWQQQGLLRQTLRNWIFVTLAHCGVSPHALARHYAQVR